MGHIDAKQIVQLGVSLMLAAVLACGPLVSPLVFADEAKTAASTEKEQGGSAELPSLSNDQGMEFVPENDPNMIDDEGDSPDSNSGGPLPTDLQHILSVRRRVGEVLYHGFSPQRLPAAQAESQTQSQSAK